MYPGAMYHMYNHANGRENLFEESKNYDFFLGRLSLHVLPVANIYAYCLMPNHFHLFFRIRSAAELTDYFTRLQEERAEAGRGVNGPEKGIEWSEEDILKGVSKSFSNLFNSYTQAFNKLYSRRGSLFRQNMRRLEVTDDISFCKVVYYIHANPVRHGFVKAIESWPHSSFRSFLSNGSTKLDREYVLQVFGGIEGFLTYHNLTHGGF